MLLRGYLILMLYLLLDLAGLFGPHYTSLVELTQVPSRSRDRDGVSGGG